MNRGKTVDIGVQSFEKIRARNSFYVDKTELIREWWENGSDATLIMRPRRFGKTLNMSMLFQASYLRCTSKTGFCWKAIR